MTDVHCIDLEHLDLPGAIASYLIEGPEPTLVDPGPATTADRLTEALGERGVGPNDLAHILLTHVHLDHAGATGDMVRRFPRATVHVHEVGAPHMADPERLVASTRRTFGDAHDRLWGETRAVPAGRIRAWRPGEPGPWREMRPFGTPGHTSHHVAYLDERTGTLFAGDALGIVLHPDAPTHPATPPPGVDVEEWTATLQEIAAVGPERAGVTHFGVHESVTERCDSMVRMLVTLRERVEEAVARGDEGDAVRFDEEARASVAPCIGKDRADRYFDTFSAATDWAGMRLYLKRNQPVR